MSKKLIIPLLLGLIINLISVGMPRVSAFPSGRLLISEIKLGGGDDPKEFVELYNDTGLTQDLSTMTLEYAKVGFVGTKCSLMNWKAAASPASQVNALTLTGSLAPAGIVYVPLSLNDASAGSLHLVSATTVYDTVGWGTEAPCFASQANALPANGSSLNRVFDVAGQPIFSPTGSDFVSLQSPSPGIIPCVPMGCEEPAPHTYPLLQITELLPDPGSPKVDSQDEYIEIYNPNEAVVSLDGYQLYVGNTTSTHSKSLDGYSLQPHEYHAFYSSETGLGLVNAGGQAWLVQPNMVRVTETLPYPATIGSDEAWALINDTWQITTTLTPGHPNEPSEEAQPLDKVAVTTGEPKTCPMGKYRNPETNRCKTIEEATTTLMPCSPGQERNPETNRCRKIVTDTEPTPCESGYVRNPDTNRCRKMSDVKAASTQTPNHAATERTKLNYYLMLGVSTMVVGYGLYEYRADVHNLYTRFRKHIKLRAR